MSINQQIEIILKICFFKGTGRRPCHSRPFTGPTGMELSADLRLFQTRAPFFLFIFKNRLIKIK
jgi:hypothetical protein